MVQTDSAYDLIICNRESQAPIRRASLSFDRSCSFLPPLLSVWEMARYGLKSIKPKNN